MDTKSEFMVTFRVAGDKNILSIETERLVKRGSVTKLFKDFEAFEFNEGVHYSLDGETKRCSKASLPGFDNFDLIKHMDKAIKQAKVTLMRRDDSGTFTISEHSGEKSGELYRFTRRHNVSTRMELNIASLGIEFDISVFQELKPEIFTSLELIPFECL
mmetsp:Transcript_6891/g.6045  ORF Transcript_6891/g.6045 Transcript_6891/m.6045 type:complete len:159 (+) Transcript_6891:142-618(+)